MNARDLGSTNESLPESHEGTPLYIHLPFCAAKCHYCDFYSVAVDGHDVDGWIECFLIELEARAPRRPRTVFIGGGTPSLLSCAQLTRVLEAMERRTHFRSSAIEVTAECNPESLDEEKARCLLDLGVNRLSIGFQSLHDDVLQLFGRVHTADDSFRAFEAARTAGVANINVDLIYAAPGQELEQWERDLERILGLRPDHVSAYNLTFEEETLFRRWLERGELQKHSEDVELEFFGATRRQLRSHGLEPYEISNFALSGRLCAHNLNYWHNGEYVGLGPSAVSKVGLARAGNVRSLHDYKRRVREHRSASAWLERPDDAARLGETWWLGLRLAEGIVPAAAWSRAGLEDWEPTRDGALAIARRLESDGWLEVAAGRYRLSERGLPLADAIAREFLRSMPDLLTRESARSSG